MQFERSTRKARQPNLTALIDVVFLLVFFFMLTTSFVKTESMELSFPSGQEVKETPQTAIRIFLHDDNRLFLDSEELGMNELKAQLRLLLFKDAERSILLLSGENVSVQRLVSVMDDIYLMGGRNVAVAEWKSGGPVVRPLVNEAGGVDMSSEGGEGHE